MTVGAFVTILAMAEGVRLRFTSSVDDRRALILSVGHDRESTSSLHTSEVRSVTNLLGAEEASAETVVMLPDLKDDGGDLQHRVVMRGVGEDAFLIRPELSIVEGRWFQPGRLEVAVGKGAARAFGGLDIGDILIHPDVPHARWTVVGHFEAGGGVHEAEVWADAATVRSAYGSGSSAVWIRVSDTGNLGRIRQLLEEDPRAGAWALAEREVFRSRSDTVTGPLRTFATIIVALMAVGTGAAAFNAAYTSVTARRRELAVVNALGFSFLVSSAALAVEMLATTVAGALVGTALASALFDGVVMIGGDVAQFAYDLAVTPSVIVAAWWVALGLGAAGATVAITLSNRARIAMSLTEE